MSKWIASRAVAAVAAIALLASILGVGVVTTTSATAVTTTSAPSVSLTPTADSFVAGRRIWLRARVRNGHVGQRVVLQRQVPGRWRDVIARRVAWKSGRVLFTIPAGTRPMQYFRVVVRKAGVPTGRSPRVGVCVASAAHPCPVIVP